MAKLKMMRFETACLQSEAKALIEDFQKVGALHLEKYDMKDFLTCLRRTVLMFMKRILKL